MTPTLTPLPGNGEVGAWCDLEGWHRGERVVHECEHGNVTYSCSGCGLPYAVEAPALCEHVVQALVAVPPGAAAMLRGPWPLDPVMVEWVDLDVRMFRYDPRDGWRCSAVRP